MMHKDTDEGVGCLLQSLAICLFLITIAALFKWLF